VLCAACGRNTTSEKKPVQFELPEIPVMLSPHEKGAFVAQHYWDKFDFSDTISLWGEEMKAEQIFADYVAVLWQIDKNEAARSILKMLKTAETACNTTFTRFVALCEKYFYEPNSPMRNDEFYIPVLEYIVTSPTIPEVDKLRPKNHLEMALKNRVGTKAADFTYTLSSGDTGRLYNIQADYTIIFFNNPDCHTCKSMREEISSLPLLSEMIQSGQLKILALYPDEDLTIWQNYRHNIPATWINAYDKNQALSKKNIYDLKAIPTLYLLSHDKSVLIKDALSPLHIEQYLEYNNQLGSFTQ
jgi:thiol-disulfide isomerase/thioredoxin